MISTEETEPRQATNLPEKTNADLDKELARFKFKDENKIIELYAPPKKSFVIKRQATRSSSKNVKRRSSTALFVMSQKKA